MNTAPKPALAIEIASIKRTHKRIEIDYARGEGKFQLKERDNPRSSFLEAFDALTPLVATICHLPADYTEVNCRVTGVVLGEQGGMTTAALLVRKGIDDASKEFVFKTPARLMGHPTQEGSYTPPLSVDDAELVHQLVEEAKLYIEGERAQGQIEFEGDGDEAEEGEDSAEEKGDDLDLPRAAPGFDPELAEAENNAMGEAVKPKKGRKKKQEPIEV